MVKDDTSLFAERLRNGELLVGTLISLPSPEVTEIMAKTGFDWLFIDAEHGAFNPQQAQALLQAAGKCPCVVRVPSDDEVWIKKALDIGAAGLIFPQVHTAEQAANIINKCKYSPEGSRGIGIGRAHDYGLSFEEYLETANQNTAIIIQAESRQAVENIDKITDVPGIDAILIGPNDLAASLGKRGKLTDPEVESAIELISNTCLSKNIKLGFFGTSAESVKPSMKRGFTLITMGVDSLFLIKSAKESLNEIHG